MKYKQKIDRWYLILVVCIEVVFLLYPILGLVFHEVIIAITAAVIFALLNLLILPPFFGYAVLEDESLFISFGLIRKRIEYAQIRSAKFFNKYATNVPVSLTTSISHIDIKYGESKETCISIKDHEAFLEALNQRIEVEVDVEVE